MFYVLPNQKEPTARGHRKVDPVGTHCQSTQAQAIRDRSTELSFLVIATRSTRVKGMIVASCSIGNRVRFAQDGMYLSPRIVIAVVPVLPRKRKSAVQVIGRLIAGVITARRGRRRRGYRVMWRVVV